MSCHDVNIGSDFITDDSQPVPTFVHSASTFRATMRPPSRPQMWTFHKGRVPTQILNCDSPLLVPPPDHFYDSVKGSPNPFERRNAFMICVLINKVNEGALAYKEKYCPRGYNKDKCIVVVDDDKGQHLPKCNSQSDKDCYPKARDLCASGELKDQDFEELYATGMKDFETSVPDVATHSLVIPLEQETIYK